MLVLVPLIHQLVRQLLGLGRPAHNLREEVPLGFVLKVGLGGLGGVEGGVGGGELVLSAGALGGLGRLLSLPHGGPRGPGRGR